MLARPTRAGVPVVGARLFGMNPSRSQGLDDTADAVQSQRIVLLRITRMLFVVAFATITILSFLGVGFGADGQVGGPTETLMLIIGLGLGILVALVDYFTPKKKISALLTVFLGLLAGMLATLAISYIIDLLVNLYDIKNPQLVLVTKALVGIALTYLAIVTVLQTQDDFRLAIPYVEFVKQYRGTRPLLLDTSALIDGRLVDVAATGFLQAPLVVPRFVIDELQALADSQDGLKRAKGRRGLDMITKLQRSPRVDMTIDERPVPGKAADQMLVELARALPGVVVTLDSGLAKVGAIQGVPVLNIHELSNALKSSLVPGEPVTVRLVRQGEQVQQAVGYLADGTMVVAEDGAAKVGQTVELVVVSSLQTSAGRLIFARLANQEGAGTGPSTGVAAGPVTGPATGPVTGSVTGSSTTSAEAGSSADAEASAAGELASRGDGPRTGEPEASGAAVSHSVAPGAAEKSAVEKADKAERPEKNGLGVSNGSGSGASPGAATKSVRSPFPPRAPASPRQGTPRNPRR